MSILSKQMQYCSNSQSLLKKFNLIHTGHFWQLRQKMFIMKNVPHYILNLPLTLLITLNIPNYTYTPQVIPVHLLHLWPELFKNYIQ